MNYDQIMELKQIKARKNIKNKDIAKHVGLSSAYISMFFSHRAPSIKKEKAEAIKNYILQQPEYRTIKIRVSGQIGGLNETL